MKIYMSNIERTNDITDMERKLSKSELAQYNKFNNKTRKKQYLVGHAIVKDVCGENVQTDENGAPYLNNGFISIAHKDNFVIVAISDEKVGIDIENTTVQRDFVAQSELLGLPKTRSLWDFYKEFVRYESKLKFGNDTQKYSQYFYKLNNYIICITTTDDEIQFINYDESFSDASGLVQFLCAENGK